MPITASGRRILYARGQFFVEMPSKSAVKTFVQWANEKYPNSATEVPAHRGVVAAVHPNRPKVAVVLVEMPNISQGNVPHDLRVFFWKNVMRAWLLTGRPEPKNVWTDERTYRSAPMPDVDSEPKPNPSDVLDEIRRLVGSS